jgi:hypothetical protein
VAVDSRRRHQRGEAVEQVRRRQGLGVTEAGTRFQAVVAKALVIELRLAISKDEFGQRDAFVRDTMCEASIPVAIAMAGGYAENLDAIVDIHFATFRLALRRFPGSFPV